MNSLKLSVERRQRSSRSGYEFFKHEGRGFINFWVGSPTVHRWYAFSVHLYFKY